MAAIVVHQTRQVLDFFAHIVFGVETDISSSISRTAL